MRAKRARPSFTGYPLLREIFTMPEVDFVDSKIPIQPWEQSVLGGTLKTPERQLFSWIMRNQVEVRALKRGFQRAAHVEQTCSDCPFKALLPGACPELDREIALGLTTLNSDQQAEIDGRNANIYKLRVMLDLLIRERLELAAGADIDVREGFQVVLKPKLETHFSPGASPESVSGGMFRKIFDDSPVAELFDAIKRGDGNPVVFVLRSREEKVAEHCQEEEPERPRGA